MVPGRFILAAVVVAAFHSLEHPVSQSNDRRIDYIEFASTDVAAVRTFYHDVFGWKFTDYGPSYTSFEDGRMTGGFDGDAPPGRPPLVVIYAADLEDAKARVTKAGAKVFNEHSFPGGRRFHFVDPGGTELAVWSEK